MMPVRWLLSCSFLSLLLLASLTRAADRPQLLLPDFAVGSMAEEAVFFAFDETAFPFQSRVQTHLVPGKFHSIAIAPGPKGSHDEFVRYYGTVIRINETFHLWYYGNNGPEPATIGYGQGSHPGKVLCYARSTDGIHWEKPNLGFVEFNGSKANNIVDFPEPAPRPAAAILYEPEDPDPGRRYKMAYEADRNGGPTFCVAFSPDGLHWTQSTRNPVGGFCEMAGVAKFRGKYYVSGQDGTKLHSVYKSRQLATFVSTDFEHWSPCAAIGLNRTADLDGTAIEQDWNMREEVHLGAALWNRGNVLLGIYGQWHGAPSGDRRQIVIDLGLTLTHDAVHHVEPIPNFKFIAAREQPGSPDETPAVMQGQGMENVGDKTYYWYSLWKGNEGTGVRLATWDRDRLGSLKPIYPAAPEDNCQVISCPFTAAPGSQIKFFLNASGLSKNASLRLTLLDAKFEPIPGYTASIAETALHRPVLWENGKSAGADLGECHVQVRFEGVRLEDATLHALYLQPQAL